MGWRPMKVSGVGVFMAFSSGSVVPFSAIGPGIPGDTSLTPGRLQPAHRWVTDGLQLPLLTRATDLVRCRGRGYKNRGKCSFDGEAAGWLPMTTHEPATRDHGGGRVSRRLAGGVWTSLL